ncbi:MAG: NrdH-redoxin [Parcubacteria group bacterium RIFCSPLOWO2_01_FULL_40_65]|nr:MAG: NrdH-redoxin [Parcubacteria group bacterium RIFCSPHIGHO2_01_FULL_40_30]OHB19292.1 MAG: NrdH-redoxin [Parcubacteria group bacterium RIFCSPHIGHO2_02_FULL_40_12]OHB21043.1 MAG: NrdH-redoxin [Parcubacteria group bacterium RIFCSPLOWO2_01_FULL_40_65]OHB23366.1 MAG: NrdH-redoxin [Parcubacteria group bacterium RIFCSPLOWO2_02_FULL_40_12]OHB24491.1 MAG: NrdH-redoxin [Parcubacteria group bacterium RIFCSPLOWO2_12_FULL_40_10]
MEKKSVKIYTTSTCVYCRGAKEYFEKKGVEYEEINLSEHSDRIQEMIQISGQMGVPVILIDGKVIVGFNLAAINEALNLN